MFLSTLSAAVGGARSTKAQIAAIETFTAVAPLLQDIGPHALRCGASVIYAECGINRTELLHDCRPYYFPAKPSAWVPLHADCGNFSDLCFSKNFR